KVPDAKQEALSSALSSLKSTGLTVTIQKDEAETETANQHWAELTLVGQDRPGIVRQISQTLVRFGINVEELETQCSSAAMSGETLFQASAKVKLPREFPSTELRKELEKIAADLMVEIKWNEIKPAA